MVFGSYLHRGLKSVEHLVARALRQRGAVGACRQSAAIQAAALSMSKCTHLFQKHHGSSSSKNIILIVHATQSVSHLPRAYGLRLLAAAWAQSTSPALPQAFLMGSWKLWRVRRVFFSRCGYSGSLGAGAHVFKLATPLQCSVLRSADLQPYQYAASPLILWRRVTRRFITRRRFRTATCPWRCFGSTSP